MDLHTTYISFRDSSKRRGLEEWNQESESELKALRSDFTGFEMCRIFCSHHAKQAVYRTFYTF